MIVKIDGDYREVEATPDFREVEASPDFLTRARAQRRDEFYSHVRPEIQALAERAERVTWSEYRNLCNVIGCNSYERKLLYANFDDDALLQLFYLYCANSRRDLGEFELASDYDDAIRREIAPLLAKRLREIGRND